MQREDQLKRIAWDCIHFKANQPCQPHRRAGAICRCRAYSPAGLKVLIIQLASPAAIIRSNALVHRLVQEDPNCRITYLTEYPELLGADVANPMRLAVGSSLALQMDNFDGAYNLDMDPRACAIMNLVNAETKKGFYLRQGRPTPLDHDSQGHYLATLFPGAWAERQPHPLQEMFQMCGLEYRYEKPRLTGVTTELPQTDRHIALFLTQDACSREDALDLIQLLQRHDFIPVLLGTARTDAFISEIARDAQLDYCAHQTWQTLPKHLSRCAVTVSTDQSAAEMTLALGGEAILLGGHYDIGAFNARGCALTGSAAAPPAVLDAVLKRMDHRLLEPVAPRRKKVRAGTLPV